MANERFLDQEGLRVLWEQIKLKFIDNDELSAELANYESKAELVELLSNYVSDTELAAELAKYVVKNIVSADGKAMIFNEADGGGAKFEGANGYASFAGVNSNVKDGIGAQLYDINVAENKGSKLDVTADGIFYTSGDDSAKPAAQRDIEANELATKKDIKALGEALHYIGMAEIADGETLSHALDRVVAEYQAAHLGYELHAGAVAIIKGADAAVEYIYDGSKWEEFGDEGIYETKLEAAQMRSELEALINEEVIRAKAEEAKKVDKEIAGANGRAQIFNEADGGGAHFIHNDGTEAFVGVNDGGKDGLMAQIYADEAVDGGWVGSRINVYNDKIYYTNRAAVEGGAAKNEAQYEIATKKDLAELEIDALTEEEIKAICI